MYISLGGGSSSFLRAVPNTRSKPTHGASQPPRIHTTGNLVGDFLNSRQLIGNHPSKDTAIHINCMNIRR